MVDVVAGLIMTGVVLAYLFGPNGADTIKALASGTGKFVNALQGRDVQ